MDNSTVKEAEHSGSLFMTTTILLLLAGVVDVCANFLIVAVVALYKTLRKKIPSMNLIGFLAAMDGLNGIAGVTASIDRLVVALTKPHVTRARCFGSHFLLQITLVGSQVMIFAVAFDRYLAMSNPTAYKLRNHFRHALLWFVVCITYCTAGAVALFFTGDLSESPPVCNLAGSWTQGYTYYFAVVTTAIPLGVIACYSAVLIKLWFHNPVSTDQFQAKVSKAIGIVLIIYIVCWSIPSQVFNISVYIDPTNKSLHGAMGPVMAAGSAINAGSNFFIYSYKIPEFRKYLALFFKCKSDHSKEQEAANRARTIYYGHRPQRSSSDGVDEEAKENKSRGQNYRVAKLSGKVTPVATNHGAPENHFVSHRGGARTTGNVADPTVCVRGEGSSNMGLGAVA